MSINGSCLCGNVSFEITGKISELYYCHCSLCRKFTGTANHAIISTAKKGLTWLKGKDAIASYTAPSGYYAVFCSSCGSPLPKTAWDKIYIVPAGILDGDPEIRGKVHLHVASKASWQEITDGYPQHEHGLPRRNA